MNWKLNRLRNWYAWKYWFSFANILLVILLICAVYLSLWIPGVTDLKTLMWVLLALLLVYSTIDSVCTPQEFHILEKGKTYICVYKEYVHHFCIIVHNGGTKTEIWTSEYDHLFKDAPSGYLIYRSYKDEQWYLWRKNAEEKLLGERLNKILFRPTPNSELVVLAYNELKSLGINYISCKDVYIPQGAETTNMENELLETPDEVLMVRNGDSYESYGFYLSSEMPYCCRVVLSSIVLRECRRRTLLFWDKEKKAYVVHHRSQEIHRRLNAYFYELDNRYRIGGKILLYDEKRKSLECIYEGNFRTIDFENGLIYGDDGKVYGGR